MRRRFASRSSRSRARRLGSMRGPGRGPRPRSSSRPRPRTPGRGRSGLDDDGTGGEQLGEPAGRRQGEQRIEAEPAQRGLLAGRVAQQQAAEASRVGHDELATVVERQPDLPVAGAAKSSGRCTGPEASLRGVSPGTRNPPDIPKWKRGWGGASEVEPELLAPPAGGEHPPAAERLPRRGRDAAIDDGILRTRDLRDAPARRHRLREPAAPLYLGQLRHVSSRSGGRSRVPRRFPRRAAPRPGPSPPEPVSNRTRLGRMTQGVRARPALAFRGVQRSPPRSGRSALMPLRAIHPLRPRRRASSPTPSRQS